MTHIISEKFKHTISKLTIHWDSLNSLELRSKSGLENVKLMVDCTFTFFYLKLSKQTADVAAVGQVCQNLQF